MEAFANRVSLLIHIAPSVWPARGGEARIRGWSSSLRNPVASSDRVRHRTEPGLAGADRVALPVDVALCVPPAGARQAGVGSGDTLVVAADHAGPAVGIPFALSTASSDCVRHGDVRGQASADGIACSADHAFGVWPAWTWIAGVWLLDAPLVLTDVTLLAVWVSDTLRPAAGDCVWFGNEARLAPTNGVASKVGRADCSWSARTGHAGVGFDNAALAPADMALLTVRIPHTLRLTPGDGVRVRNKASLTPTDCVSCSVHHALGAWTAGAWNTRIGFLDTALVLADLASKAVGVSNAFRTTAGDCVRLGHESGLASANCIAGPCCHAPCTRATRAWVAWIRPLCAALFEANKSTAAFEIGDTLWSATRDRVRLWNQARLALTDGIAWINAVSIADVVIC